MRTTKRFATDIGGRTLSVEFSDLAGRADGTAYVRLGDTAVFVTAVLVARESGGDVTAIFTRLVETLRERKKIREKIKTLTFMARMQAVVMGLLPIGFSYTVLKIDPSHFEFFLNDPTGKLLLAGIVVIQMFGAYLFIRFSRSPL